MTSLSRYVKVVGPSAHYNPAPPNNHLLIPSLFMTNGFINSDHSQLEVILPSFQMPKVKGIDRYRHCSSLGKRAFFAENGLCCCNAAIIQLLRRVAF